MTTNKKVRKALQYLILFPLFSGIVIAIIAPTTKLVLVGIAIFGRSTLYYYLIKEELKDQEIDEKLSK